MRTRALLAFAVAAAIANDASAQKAPETDDQKVLYAAGALLAQNVKDWNLKPEELIFVVQGLQDVASGKKPAVNLDELRPKIQAFSKARAATAAVAEKKAAEPFLQKAAAEKGAKKTASGLVIQSQKAGSGASPKESDRVKVHYHGTLLDGSVFDSSVDRGEPVTFPLNGVIPCWTEGLQLMKVGEKAKLVCPSEIAYGDTGAPPRIKPGATLVFDVELLGIEPAAKPAEPAPTP
ncbi:FKBP-type peptidyl-prolyl cis-trans isomerase FkpA [Myxococcaceae bacterium]|jgi:FKBP-type peptidyl-prolyl cis-trans isomerase|nr:FKBP-type peptidyl-prolyl cis-trans isomerase FkpA [Myxococcaceae bacterium]